MNSRLNVIGIGNAMVDAIIPSTKEDVLKNGINRDSMNLIDEQIKNNLHDKYLIKEMIGGGSLGNSMFGITSFGGNGSFIGKIKEDKVGKYLQQDMVQEGLRFPLDLPLQMFQLVVAQFLLKKMVQEQCALI